MPLGRLTLFNYIALQFLRWIVGFFVLGAAIIFMADFVELVRRTVDKEGFSSATALLTSALKTPSLAEEFLPFAVLFGAIGAFMALNRNLELVVMRGSGVSVWQFVAPPIVVALAIGVLATTVYNPVSAYTRDKANDLVLALLGEEQRLFHANTKGVWFRQDSDAGNSIMHARSASSDGRELFEVNAYLFGADRRFRTRVMAPKATLERRRWHLPQATVFHADGSRETAELFEIETYLSPSQVRDAAVQASALSFWQLPTIMRLAERAGLPSYRYELQFQVLLSRPLLLAAMVLIAATVSLRLVRFGGARLALTGGVVAGFVLYLVGEIAGDLGRAGIVAPPLAAWTPGIAALLFSASRLLRTEDG